METIGNLAWAGPARAGAAAGGCERGQSGGIYGVSLPGHTRGSIALLRESDRAMIAGDIINSNDYLSGMITLIQEPPRVFSENPPQGRARGVWRLWSPTTEPCSASAHAPAAIAAAAGMLS